MSDIDIDIVIRLRNSDPTSNVGRRMREAADEIERLRAEGAKHVDEINHLWDVIDKLRDGRVV